MGEKENKVTTLGIEPGPSGIQVTEPPSWLHCLISERQTHLVGCTLYHEQGLGSNLQLPCGEHHWKGKLHEQCNSVWCLSSFTSGLGDVPVVKHCDGKKKL